jgi:hypothetical protein
VGGRHTLENAIENGLCVLTKCSRERGDSVRFPKMAVASLSRTGGSECAVLLASLATADLRDAPSAAAGSAIGGGQPVPMGMSMSHVSAGLDAYARSEKRSLRRMCAYFESFVAAATPGSMRK